jgi:ATP-dependent phosphofructokinase / diphosphate-dependent phosphofructokinase
MSNKVLAINVGSEVAGFKAAYIYLLREMQKQNIACFMGVGGFSCLTSDEADSIQRMALNDTRFSDTEINEGGTFNGVSRYDLAKQDQQTIERALKKLQHYKPLIVFGGDGTAQQMKVLYDRYKDKGFPPFLIIPRSIDGNIGNTDEILGYRTAIEFAVDNLKMKKRLAASDNAIVVLEMQGGNSDRLQRNVIEAATVATEDVYFNDTITSASLDALALRVYTNVIEGRKARDRSQAGCLVTVGEFIEDVNRTSLRPQASDTSSVKECRAGNYILAELEQRILKLNDTGIPIRFFATAYLGYDMRNANPVAHDIALAKTFMQFVARCIKEKRFNGMVAIHDGKPVLVPIAELTGGSITHAQARKPSFTGNGILLTRASAG